MSSLQKIRGPVNEEYEKQKDKAQKKLFDWIMVVCTVILISIVLVIFIFHPVLVVGDSMEPTFHGGHFVFTKNSFTREDLTYNTVIVFSTDDSRLIKRIVALPGDTVIVKSDGVYVNNELQKDNFGTPSPVMDKPVTLGEDEYFVLGDNRDYSLDSRTIGAVPFEKITHIVTTESH